MLQSLHITIQHIINAYQREEEEGKSYDTLKWWCAPKVTGPVKAPTIFNQGSRTRRQQQRWARHSSAVCPGIATSFACTHARNLCSSVRWARSHFWKRDLTDRHVTGSTTRKNSDLGPISRKWRKAFQWDSYQHLVALWWWWWWAPQELERVPLSWYFWCASLVAGDCVVFFFLVFVGVPKLLPNRRLWRVWFRWPSIIWIVRAVILDVPCHGYGFFFGVFYSFS